MMFQGEDSSVMSEEDKTQHKGSEATEKARKTSHGNEVKYFTRCNATISIFYPLDSSRNDLLSSENEQHLKHFYIIITSVPKTKNQIDRSSFFEIETA